MASQRLTEEEVHRACLDITQQGERPTSLTLLHKLGRGSLTTITKYLVTWNAAHEEQDLKVDNLPVVVNLPSELSKEGGDLLKKIWHVAKTLADTELAVQREALRQAGITNQHALDEAFTFSEVQTQQIETLEEELGQKTSTLTETERVVSSLTKDNGRLHIEVADLTRQVSELYDARKALLTEKQDSQKEQDALRKEHDREIRTLELANHKLQSSLQATLKINEELDIDLKSRMTDVNGCLLQLEKLTMHYEAAESELTQLKTDLANKAAALSGHLIAFEKLTVIHEATLTELNAAKSDLTVANRAIMVAEKAVSKLEGNLETYKVFDNYKAK